MAIRDLTKSERLHAAIAEARKLADSGAYHDYTDIEYVLRFDHGLSDVSALLDSPGIHRDLNLRCADARERHVLIACEFVSVAPRRRHKKARRVGAG